ncbi:MAG: flagellar basal body rod C-terminal domain-containing protein [Solidesulfovibrio sp.]|uniref:flagellar basal body rod C-terminal domain-containing protein n=1 Tax=Solidesulfovibrio sp. TaxID=2910990 RepID=UPI002B1FBA1E|nr:flagellar basal body rod C-terminal domain-containing protein [Solidesulfovibrio sp.]MEA4857368.1 flagellar basal body rod C-terminal domain-containing protein [Solidesulfovibrio sp.]
MTDAIAAAHSALGAMSTSLAVSANNVANATTDGYKSREARLADGPDARSVQVTDIVRDDAAGGLNPTVVEARDEAGVPAPGVDLVEMSNVNLVRQNVNMIEASRAFEAGAAVIRTADDMAGTLLDRRV